MNRYYVGNDKEPLGSTPPVEASSRDEAARKWVGEREWASSNGSVTVIVVPADRDKSQHVVPVDKGRASA